MIQFYYNIPQHVISQNSSIAIESLFDSLSMLKANENEFNSFKQETIPSKFYNRKSSIISFQDFNTQLIQNTVIYIRDTDEENKVTSTITISFNLSNKKYEINIETIYVIIPNKKQYVNQLIYKVKEIADILKLNLDQSFSFRLNRHFNTKQGYFINNSLPQQAINNPHYKAIFTYL